MYQSTNAAAGGKTGFSARDIVFAGIFAALITVCSWISIPATVPFTLQTFAVFLACLVLGGKLGTVSVIVYILLGAIGLPVFSGFKGGMGALLGTTGGYIIGFVFTALLLWALERFYRGKKVLTALCMVLGLLVCYAFGTCWFMLVYSRANGPVGLMTTLGWCVIPFIIPDLIKIALALVLAASLKRAL